MSWNFTSAINIGDRSQQQDRVEILHSPNNTHLLIVADGMGGHDDGALAAQTVIDVATRHFQDDDFSQPGDVLENICLDAHKAISALSSNRVSPPGSTCVLLYLTEKEAYWTYVGDSRLYQFSNNQFMYKTRDHSMIHLMETKNNTPEIDEASQNQLYMCLGGNNAVIPESMGVSINPGDQFLLCSDGLWGQIDLEAPVQNNDSVLDQTYAENLIESARGRGAGKSDNICLAWAYRQESVRPEASNWFTRMFRWFQ